MKTIENLKTYLSKIEDGEKVYEFLRSVNEKTTKGRHDFNLNLYVNVVSYGTKNGNSFDGVFESHREYIDVHVLISGEEKIFYGKKRDMSIMEKYDETDDYEMLKGDKYSFVEYGKMQGVELPVNEPHMAGYAIDKKCNVFKAIVKIRNKK